MSLSFLSLVWQDINQGGQLRLVGLSAESRYNPLHESLLGAIDFDAEASSIEVYAPQAGFGNIALFENGDFSGSFCQVSADLSEGPAFANLTDYQFNDKTRSILAIRTDPREFRLSFRSLFLGKWNSIIDSQLGSDASRVGDPVMTWEMFPESVSYLDENLPYLKIQQSLNINVPDWFDYDAWIKYHIYLYLDGNSKLQGYCARWEYWIEGGIKTGRIDDKLRPKVIAGADTLTTQLGIALNSPGPFRSFYYLPGYQSASWQGVTTGSTTDDVTLVLGIE